MRIFAIVILISGLAYLAGGAYLAYLGGSWYYLIAGIGLTVAGGELACGRTYGAYWFYLVYVGTFIWTAWESGLDYWRWVPRLDVVTVLALFLGLLLPTLHLGATKRLSRFLASSAALIFIFFFALSWAPHRNVEPTEELPTTPLVSNPTPINEQPDGDWRYYGRDEHATRYSPLNQITPENVKQLKQAWVFRTGDLPPVGKTNKWAAETTPIKVDDGMYLCSARNDLFKLDPATGKEVWHWKSGVRYQDVPYTATCKGVTYYVSTTVPEGQACHKRIIEATLDERLIAVDADTGKLCEGFGEHGQVNLLKGMGETVPGFVAEDTPPPIINGVLVTNHEVRDNQRRWAPSGVIRGFSAETGQFLWAWDVNRPHDHGEPPPGQSYSRGTPNSWAAMVGDDKLGLVYVPTGNSAADYWSALRSPAENAVSSSVVALDVKTGEPRWVFQTTHKDVWDYDIGSQPTLFDYPGKNGEPIPAIFVSTKRGQNFVLDRRDGHSLTPVEERPAPPSALADDPRAPTQPWSIGMPALDFPRLTERDTWGISTFDHLWCRIKFKRAAYEGAFTAPRLGQPWIEYPGYNGGTDWGSVAYDPQRGIVIANWNNTPMFDRLITRSQANELGVYPIDSPKYTDKAHGVEGIGAMGDTPYAVIAQPFMNSFTMMLCNEPPYGMVTAIDMHNHKVIWQHPMGTGRANGPFRIPSHLSVEVGTPNNGGPIITAGGLTFVAAATDDLLRAIDMKTGKVVWTTPLPAGGQATPMTYSVNGKQYVVIVAGGHHFMQTAPGDYVIAYALPDGSNGN